MDYMELALELGKVKTLMVKIPHKDKIADIQSGEKFVLGYLSKNNKKVNPKEISSTMNVSTARMSAILNQLESKEMIERCVDPQNGRQTLVQLMPKGIQQQKINEKEFLEYTVKFLKALGPEDAIAYIRIQKKIIKFFEDKK
ncbi:MarR family transcriptional regulator [Clostridioides sp. ZZV14-6009]|nr:MarR family transcriptional regulator [Clostridioides sp. ZZV14-6150]MCC0666807.1 MarR family transcriptional regulator [Clostridioides sp. ZZV14-6153]MCC0725890.1 MarR family transcriptional regulator [Clostridioides sp. ZZV14-6045]MCC0733981.1 MarR family transcriptional regulator [Clostridioides sp. ZZV14-6009]